MADHSETYPDQDAILTSRDFQRALETFKEGVAKPDLEPALADLEGFMNISLSLTFVQRYLSVIGCFSQMVVIQIYLHF